MKVKRFNNLWAMGLVLCGIILVALYLIKILFPSFIIGLAEIPSIVSFGEFVDTNLWAYYLVNGLVSIFVAYMLCCIACLKTKLNLYQTLLCFVCTIILFIIQTFAIEIYVEFNYAIMVIVPIVCVKMDKNTNIKCLYALGSTLSTFWISQALTIKIRDISVLINYPNTATFLVLMLDTFIWLILFYLYYNYKGEKKNG